MIFSLIKYWTEVLFFEAGMSWPLDLDVGFIACFLLIIGEADHQTLSTHPGYNIPVSKADMSRGERGENVSKYSRMGTWTFHKECIRKERMLNLKWNIGRCGGPGSNNQHHITSLLLLWPENLWSSSELATEALKVTERVSLWWGERGRDWRHKMWTLRRFDWEARNGGMGTKFDERHTQAEASVLKPLLALKFPLQCSVHPRK